MSELNQCHNTEAICGHFIWAHTPKCEECNCQRFLGPDEVPVYWTIRNLTGRKKIITEEDLGI